MNNDQPKSSPLATPFDVIPVDVTLELFKMFDEDACVAVSTWAEETTPRGEFVYRKGDVSLTLDFKKGSLEWRRAGRLHRDNDLPAVVKTDGTRSWYRSNVLHRDGGLPAAVDTTGFRAWHEDGAPHRGGNKPCLSTPGGTRRWGERGVLHRLDGPAEIEEPKAMAGCYISFMCWVVNREYVALVRLTMPPLNMPD